MGKGAFYAHQFSPFMTGNPSLLAAVLSPLLTPCQPHNCYGHLPKSYIMEVRPLYWTQKVLSHVVMREPPDCLFSWRYTVCKIPITSRLGAKTVTGPFCIVCIGLMTDLCLSAWAGWPRCPKILLVMKSKWCWGRISPRNPRIPTTLLRGTTSN